MDFIKTIYYEILSYFVPQKVMYKIEGTCNKCGKCCREIRSLGLKSERELKLMQFIIPYYKRFFILGKDESGEFVLSCKYLNDNNLCSVYDKRASVCKNYPAKFIYSNKDMIDGCGYKVIKKSFKDYL